MPDPRATTDGVQPTVRTVPEDIRVTRLLRVYDHLTAQRERLLQVYDHFAAQRERAKQELADLGVDVEKIRD